MYWTFISKHVPFASAIGLPLTRLLVIRDKGVAWAQIKKQKCLYTYKAVTAEPLTL